MTEQVDLDALYHIADVAEFLNESITMSPDQFRTVLHEMTANRAVVEAMGELMGEVRDMSAKVMAERNTARVALARIVDEFGDYESLRQSREICDDRMQKLRDVRTLHKELSSEKYAHDFLTNAAFHAVIEMLGQILDGTFVSET